MSAFEGCPAHYRGDGTVSCSDAMGSMVAGWCREDLRPMELYWGECALKYLWRWPLKGKPVEDIDKAIDCLQKLKETVTGEDAR